MNPSPATTVAVEINRLFEEIKQCSFASRQALHAALAAAWHAGQLLLAEKKRVRSCMGHGSCGSKRTFAALRGRPSVT